MNSPQPFALAMMAGLLFAFAAKGPFRFLAAGPGHVSLLLSLVRTAWLGWVIEHHSPMMAVLARGEAIYAIGDVTSVELMPPDSDPLAFDTDDMLVCLLSLPLLLLEPVADRVTGRFETMQQIEGDDSFRARLTLYSDFFLTASNNVVGEGIGSANRATKLAEGDDFAEFRTIDSGILEAMFVLGWPGTLVYVAGLAWLLSEALSGRAPRQDLSVQAAGAVLLAILAMTVSYNTLINVGGMVFWTFLGLMLSARTFYRRPYDWHPGIEIGLTVGKASSPATGTNHDHA